MKRCRFLSYTARQTFDQYSSYLKAEAQGLQITGNQARMNVTAIDPLYGRILVEQSGRYITGAVRVKSISVAKQLIEQLHGRIDAAKGD